MSRGIDEQIRCRTVILRELHNSGECRWTDIIRAAGDNTVSVTKAKNALAWLVSKRYVTQDVKRAPYRITDSGEKFLKTFSPHNIIKGESQ